MTAVSASAGSCDQAVEQRGLAGAQEAGQHGERDRLGRTERGGRRRGSSRLRGIAEWFGAAVGRLGRGLLGLRLGDDVGVRGLRGGVLVFRRGRLGGRFAAAGLLPSASWRAIWLGGAVGAFAALRLSLAPAVALAVATGFRFFGLISASTGSGSPGLRRAGVNHDRLAEAGLPASAQRPSPSAAGSTGRSRRANPAPDWCRAPRPRPRSRGRLRWLAAHLVAQVGRLGVDRLQCFDGAERRRQPGQRLPLLKPRSSSCAAFTARAADDGAPSTTAISRLPPRVADATRLNPEAQMKPVFMPSAPA